ncbi:MAG: PilZ domain-containing protein [Zetaproteobacteria bacterium CG1_02_53_45]|nr:MAG: PilZ domain-containing protein [Zetaproteobacteria bacterium CG1_02_53_45]
MRRSTHEQNRRQFYRHPVDVPIQVFPQGTMIEDVPICDLSEGGLAFQTNVFIEEGHILKIRIPYVHPAFEAACVVRWQKVLDDLGTFEIGVMFLDEETAFRVRMVEQVCHIKAYQEKHSGYGRDLSIEVAAQEWITKYAADFGGN